MNSTLALISGLGLGLEALGLGLEAFGLGLETPGLVNISAFSAMTLLVLGHVTRKTVSEMTYNVSSGTLNSTIPTCTISLAFDLLSGPLAASLLLN